MSKPTILLWFTITCLFQNKIVRGVDQRLVSNTAFWRDVGHKEIDETVRTVDKLYNGKAKNVVLFVGSGMDVTTVMLAGYMSEPDLSVKQQHMLNFEKFRHVGLQRVYSADQYASDASSAITAMTMGVKNRNRVLGYDSGVTPGECSSISQGVALKSMFQDAKESGRAVGLVTTGQVTGPTIASTYARTPNFEWITPGSLTNSQRSQGCKDISTQFKENAMDFDVILGGGRNNLQGKAYPDNGKNITDNWKDYQQSKGRKFKYVDDKIGFKNIDPNNTDYVLGLLAGNEMAYDLDWTTDVRVKNSQPNLKGMVKTSLEILKRKKAGFFLLVDSSNIDLAHSKTMAKYAIHDTLRLDKAVQYVKEQTDPSETLILVAANYGYTTNVGNSMIRGIDYTGLCHVNGVLQKRNGKYYSGISYGSGPIKRSNTKFLSKTAMSKNNVQYQAVVPQSHATRGGQHVAMYADGVNAHFISSAHESFHIYNTVMHAACLGEYANRSGC